MKRRQWKTLTCFGRRGPLAALGGRGEAALGSSAASSAEADPRALGWDHSPRQRGRGSGDTGRVGVHSGIKQKSNANKNEGTGEYGGFHSTS